MSKIGMLPEHIINRILKKRPDLTREDIEDMIEQRIEESGGLLSEESAAYIIASELNVNMTGIPPLKTKIAIRDLMSGAKDVSVAGRVILVCPAEEFVKADGSTGKVAKIIMGDRTGSLKVVLWDEKTDLIERGELRPGQIVRILHGQAYEGIEREVELHVGSRSEMIVTPPDLHPEDFPSIQDFFKKIKQLREGDRYVNIRGFVRQVFPISVFQKENGKEGHVMRLNLADDTGEITAVLWNDQVDVVRDVKRGYYLQLMGARVKRGIRGLELHVGRGAEVSILTEAPPTILAPPLTKIHNIREGMSRINVLARVIAIEPIRKFRRSDGSAGQVADLMVKDDTGSARLVLWDDQAKSISLIKRGDVVLVENCYAKFDRRGFLCLNLGKLGILMVNPCLPEVDTLPPLGEVTPIARLKEGIVEVIEGFLTKKPLVKEVLVGDKSVKMASFSLSDGVNEVEVTIWRELVDVVKDLKEGDRIRVEIAFVKERLGALSVSSSKLTNIIVLSSEELEME